MENTGARKETAEDLFFKFMDAEDCPEITLTFCRLVKLLGIKAESPREFYSSLKGKLQSWRCKSLWEQLDSRANQKEYGKGKICEDNQVLIIGAGPIGLRTAIELALLGAQVVIVEKRESFVRNNVLHLWPFLLTDFRSLGAKKFYGKFCSGSIDHISIRRLQAILLKSALIFGAKLYTGVTFEDVIEPNSLEDGWKCKVSPENHPVSSYEFDVLIGADGKKNVIPGFQQIEMRGTLAIGITANFVNHCTEEEANVEEISGIAYQFNPQFFDDLYANKGIKLENIVYYKDETHYFVMTAGKASLLKRGALKEDLGQSAKLLAPCNIDHSKLLKYVTDVVKYATKGTLKNLELKIVGNNQPDIAAFDFTSIKKAEHAARIIERKGSKLLVGLVGDSLLEPFWPTGSGCARGVLSALDAAWMIRSFAQDKPPLQILSERENIYRLLSGTSTENLHKDHAKYTINPSSRYLHITHKKIREVYHLYDTDDAVNADFSLGSPQTAVINKASRRRRISTGVKFTSSKGRKRGRASSHRAAESGASRIRSTSGSSMENLDMHKSLGGRLREQTTQSSAGSDDEVFERKPRRVQINPRASPLTVKGRSSPVGSSGDELKGKKKKTTRKRTLSKENLDNTKGETRKKSRGFFGFGKSKAKYKVNEDSDHHSDKESKLFKVKHGEEREKSESRPDIMREDSWKRRPAGAFSREQYTRRSARDIIREMEARSKGDFIGNGVENNDKVSESVLESKFREKDGGMKRKNNLGNGELEGRHKIKKEDEKKKHKEDEKKRKEEERKRRHEEEKQRKEDEEKARNKEEKRRHEEEKLRKEDEEKARKKEEKRRHEEEKLRKEDEEKARKKEEKRRHEEEKQRKEDEEKARKKEEEEVKKREQANNLHNKKAQSTPAKNMKSKKQALLDELAKISPSAKRAMPVLSKLSPELDKENEKGQEHSVTTVVREAAMLVMATPLLIDGLLPKKLDRTGSWLARSSGHVRDVVQRYNTLNDMKPLIKPMNGDTTPLKWPRDSVDGCEEKPCEIKSDEAQDGNENQYSVNQNDACEVKPTPPSQKKRTLQMKKDEKLLISSPSLERLKIKLQDCQDGSPLSDEGSSLTNEKPIVDFNSPIWQKTPIAAMEEIKEKNKEKEDSIDDKSLVEALSTPAHEHVVKDCSATIWQKTVIAEVTEKNDDNKENDQEAVSNSIKDAKATEKKLTKVKPSQTSRRSSISPSEQMEEKLASLLKNTSAQKAWESIKYMIGLFKQIQRHPNEEKYYRIFKGRVKFRKHIWAVRNAKLFMLASGWTEVGSFVVFPLSKQTEGPVLLLNKYLSIAEEKRLEEQSDERKENLPNLQRSCSSDLAEKIMELKEALVSSRSNSYKTRRLSGEKNSKSMFLHRAVSMDEVNKLRRTVEECSSPLKDSKHGESEFQKLNTRLEGEETEEPASNLRRSVSENSLYFSPHHNDDYPPTFSSIIRRFSQRGVKEQETSCDLVMENPLPLENSVGDKKQTQGSTSSLTDDEVGDLPVRDKLTSEQYPSCDLVMENPLPLENSVGDKKQTHGSISSLTDDEVASDLLVRDKLTSEWYPDRQAVRSPREIVLEEADQLSSVLGTILDTLGSPTDSEKESDWEPKESKKEPKKANYPRSIVDQYKDEELEALCETLDLIIQDNTSESSSESGDDKITNVKLSNPQPQTRASHENAFKPPAHPTRRTTQHLGKTKSLDAVNQSKNSTIANGRSNRERVTKTKSVDAASLTRNRRSQEGLATGTRRKISRTVPNSATNRSESSIKTRAQRNSSTSEASNRKNIGSRNKRESTSGAKRPSMKRPSSKVQSVDMDRPRTRQPLVKSKSVGYQNTGIKAPGQTQAKTRSSRTSSSEDDKKPQSIKTAERGRVHPARRTSGKGKNQSSRGGVKNRRIVSSSEENKSTVESERSKRSREHLAKDKDNVCNTEVVPEIKEKSSSQAVPQQHETDSYSGSPLGSSRDKTVAANGQERGSWDFEDLNQENQTLPVNFDNEDEIQLENHNEIVDLSKEIQSYYAEIPLLPNCHVSEGAEGKREITEAKTQLPIESELPDFDQDSKQPVSVPEERCNGGHDFRSKENGFLNQTEDADKQCTQSQTSNRKMTLLDIGKQQSRARSARKETVSLSLDDRKQQILEAADAKPQSKPTNKRRSILQIKNRNDGNLVKNKKETFEKPNLAQAPSVNGSLNKSPRRRLLRFHGRRKKSFELSNEQLYVVPEDNEGEVEEKINGVIPSKEAQDARHQNGVTKESKTECEKIEKIVEKEKNRSPVKISPFQLRFIKQRGSYDLEKRVDSVESSNQYPGEYE